MSKSNLLREAIADAKAVKETALQNAKMSLEEAFRPKLQSMLSKKLAQEADDDEAALEATEEEPAPEQDAAAEAAAAVAAPEETEEEPAATEAEVPAEDTEDDLSVENVIKELEAEIGDEDLKTEDDAEVDIDLEDDTTECVTESEVAPDTDGTSAGKGGDANSTPFDTEKTDKDNTLDTSISGLNQGTIAEGDEDEDDDEVDLNELLKTLKEEADEEDDTKLDFLKKEADDKKDDIKTESLKKQIASLRKENSEYHNALQQLRGKLNEIQLFNAKLLYTNKLFKEFALDNKQKRKVVEAFDLTKNVRETKLVYATLSESFKGSKKNASRLTESIASKVIGSTKPSKDIISEGTEMTARFQKLAGIKTK